MSPLSALRPGHWIGISVVAALLAGGAWTNAFGLLSGAKATDQLIHRNGLSKTHR